jgi:hypothetical protein
MRWFFYGSLIDPHIRGAVLGPAYVKRGRPGLLSDYEARLVRGEIYPALKPMAGGKVHGWLVERASPYARRRMRFFEGDEYRVGQVKVLDSRSGELVIAAVFLPRPDIAVEATLWSLTEHWQKNGRKQAVRHCKAMFAALRRPAPGKPARHPANATGILDPDRR